MLSFQLRRGIRGRRIIPSEQHRLPMSSMIDVVFLLLVFFVMTFKITSVEGEFAVGGADAQVVDAANLPLRLQLTARSDGQLQSISLNGRQFASLTDLQLELIAMRETETLRDATLTIDADVNLKYQYLIQTLDHVTAYRDLTGTERPLVTSTRFAC